MIPSDTLKLFWRWWRFSCFGKGQFAFFIGILNNIVHVFHNSGAHRCSWFCLHHHWFVVIAMHTGEEKQHREYLSVKEVWSLGPVPLLSNLMVKYLSFLWSAAPIPEKCQVTANGESVLCCRPGGPPYPYWSYSWHYPGLPWGVRCNTCCHTTQLFTWKRNDEIIIVFEFDAFSCLPTSIRAAVPLALSSAIVYLWVLPVYKELWSSP